jgi:hypothetical protein
VGTLSRPGLDSYNMPRACAPGAARVVAVCAVCEALREDEHELRLAAADRLVGNASAAEAIVDSMGFCGSHVFVPARSRHEAEGLAGVLREATDSLIGMLADGDRYFERLFDLFFGADRSCAACKAHDQRVSHGVREFVEAMDLSLACPPLCCPHYRNVVYSSKGVPLAALARSVLQTVQGAAARIVSIDEQWRSGSGDEATIHSELAPILNVVAGEGGIVAGTTGRAPSERGPQSTPRCGVCAELVHAERHWLDMVQRAAKLGDDVWTVFPTCPIHLKQCARLPDPGIAVSTARYAAEVVSQALERGIEALALDNRNREVAARSVFYRRQGAAYVLGQQRKMVTHLPSCPACERALVAQEHGIARALGALRLAPQGRADDEVKDLCIRHFAAVYLHTVGGAARSRLVALQAERLRELSAQLAQAVHWGEPARATDVLRQAVDAWQTAMPRAEGAR